MQELIYSVDIYPKGENAPKVTLIFEKGKEEKMEYVRQEHSYCLREENDYQTAEHSTRKEKKDIFLKKRVEFAKKCGFAPVKGNVSVWKRNTQDNTLNHHPTPPVPFDGDDERTPA